MPKFNNLSGSSFGFLKVIERGSDYIQPCGKREVRWVCECKCGKTANVDPDALKSGRQISCGCYKTSILATQGKKNRKGTSNISGFYFSHLSKNAKQRKLEFSITIEYIQLLLEKQQYKCALSDIPLIMNVENSRRSKSPTKNTASLDRIDSSKGYVEGNVQWVHKDINTMKWNLVQENFIEYCRLIAKKFS